MKSPREATVCRRPRYCTWQRCHSHSPPGHSRRDSSSPSHTGGLSQPAHSLTRGNRLRSKTATRRPPRTSTRAQALPAGPPPTMMASNGVTFVATRTKSYMDPRAAPLTSYVWLTLTYHDRVVERVAVLSVDDGDGHAAGDPGEGAGPRVRDDGDADRALAARHGADVLEDEAAGAAVERADDALDRDVPRRALHVRARGEHLHVARRVEIAPELLRDAHPGEAHAVEGVVGGLPVHGDVEAAGGAGAHAPCLPRAATARQRRSTNRRPGVDPARGVAHPDRA